MKKKTVAVSLLFLAMLFVFTFSGNLLAADTCKVTVRTGIAASSGSEMVKVEIYDASETKVPSVYTAGSSMVYATTQIQVAPGTYTYKGYSVTSASFLGSGKFTVDKDGQVITLKCVIFPKISSPANKNHVWNSDKSYEYVSGIAGNNFLLPAIGGNGHYHYAYVPDDSENYWGSNGKLYVYATITADSFMGLNLSDSGSFIVAKKVTITAKVPHGANFDIYNMVKFYRPLEVMKKSEPQREGDYDVYTVEIPDRSSTLHYELRLEGKVTKARMVNSQDYTSTPLVINESDLADNPKQILRDSSQDFRDANLLMNVNDAGYLAMKTGDHFDLRCYRNWQAISSITGNYYVEPDYHYAVAEGDSVTVDEQGRITAVKDGVSVIHVTYDALDWLSDTNKPMIYSAIYPENTGTIVVNVNADRSTVIKTNINRSSEYDTIYYTKSINGTAQEKQYAEYTFTPAADQDISVRVQNPLTTDWSEGWESYTANSDGSFTVRLHDGRNIIELKSGNSVEYWVLRAYGLDLSIIDTKTGVAIGDTVPLDSSLAITFNGITSPLAKLGAVYNPGFPDGIYVVYDHDGQTLEGTHTQYSLKTTNTLHIDCDEAGTYTLTGGTIHGNVIGGGGGMHRGLTLGGNTGSDNSYESDGMSGISFDGYLSVLPDISIEVVGQKDEAAIAALSFCKITYQSGNPSISLGSDSIRADRTSTLDDTLKQVMTSNVNSSSVSKRALNYKVKSDHPTQVKMFLRYWTEKNPTPTLMPVIQNQTAITPKFSKYDDVTYAELILVPDASAKAYNKTYTLRVSCATETETKTANPLYGDRAYLIGLDIIPMDGLAQYSTLHGQLKADPITYTDGNGDSQTLDLGYGFLGTELNYSTTVPGTTSQIQIMPAALVEGDATPAITVNGETVVSGATSQVIDLDEGNNQITVRNTTGSDTKTYTVNVYREDAPRTVTFSGQSVMTVIAYDEDGRKYSQRDDDTMILYPGDYTYFASCSGYLVKRGSFTVTKTESNTVAVGALTAVPTQQGSVSVNVIDDDAVLRDTTITIASSPADLAKQKYVEYNNGGYTALHAIIDALDSGTTAIGFACKKGNLTPDTTISTTNQGDKAGWVCEINGKTVEPASTLVYAGDKIDFYYNADYDGMVHAFFTEKIKTVEAGSSGSFMLMATAVKNDGSLSTAVANAKLYVNGKDSGVKTDATGKATLNAFPAAGKYIVTAVKENAAGDNVLTYTYCTVTATKPSAGTDTISVTFRLIGDTLHQNGTEDHEKYVNWIATRSYTFDAESVTVYDVFTRALDGASLSYIGAEKNYVRNITAPVSYGGYTIGEFDNGTFSGWMYTLNADHPNWGLKEQEVADGDVIIWHYVDNYIEEAEDGAIYPYRWLEADDTEPDYITANIAIYELPDASDVTLRDKDAIGAARVAYDKLSTEEKGYISSDRLAKLVADEAKLAELSAADQTAAQTVINQIAALPDAKSLTLADGNVVAAARKAYDGLTDTQKSLVTNYSTLTAAEAALAALNESPVTNVENMGDVVKSAWYYNSVSYVLAKGIMYGNSSTTFDPNGSITRGQFVTIIGRYAGIKDSTTSSPATTQFSDVKPSAYYAAHIAWAAANRITLGTSLTTFDPNAKITRQDMVVMITRFAKVMKINLPDGSGATVFADDDAIAFYAKTAVYSMVEAKIIHGVGNNAFSPKSTATRAQAATIIRLLIEYVEND